MTEKQAFMLHVRRKRGRHKTDIQSTLQIASNAAGRITVPGFHMLINLRLSALSSMHTLRWSPVFNCVKGN